MLKTIIVAVLAAQISVQPVQAIELPPMTPKQKQEFCHSVIGLDDALFWIWIGSMVSHVVITYFQNEVRRQEIEKLKADGAKRCST